MARRAGVRLRLRGSDRRRVDASRGALGSHRGAGIAALRARASRVRVPAAHSRRPVRARGRPHRGARSTVRRIRAPRARASRARPVRRGASSATGARPGGALLRGRRCPRHARARRRGVAVVDSRRRRARPDRARRTVGRAVARAARDRARRPRHSVRRRVAGSSRRHAVRSCAASVPAIRVARRRPSRAVHVPAFAVLGHRACGGRLRRRPAPRPRDRLAESRRGGDREAP